MPEMLSLDDALALPPDQYDGRWPEIDRLVQVYPVERQLAVWQAFADRVDSAGSKGHPYFRLGTLKLIAETSEVNAIRLLELAHEEDKKFGPGVGKLPHRMGAYILLSLAKEYFHYLNERRDWQQTLRSGSARIVLIETLFRVYNQSNVPALELPSFTYRLFFSLIKDRDLCAFAMENYYCADSLIQTFFLQGQAINKARDEYPLARSVVGLLGGVLEALLVERLPSLTGPTLGRLLSEAHNNGIVPAGSRLSALASIMLHLRNYIHADLGSRRTEYLIDINTAKGCKIALDAALNELLQMQERAEPARACN